MIQYVINLYKEKREMALLQAFFAVLAAISFIISGIIALFNQALGLGTLIVPLVFLIAFLMNIVAWSLIKNLASVLSEKYQNKSKK